MNTHKNFVIVKDRFPRISEVLNDCAGGLCVPAAIDESLSSILKKICGKINSISYTFVDTSTIDFTTNGTTITADVKISSVDGNIITAESDGIYASGVVSADNGLSVTDGVVQLGQLFDEAGDPSVFTTSREINTGVLANLFRIRGAGTNQFLINHANNDGVFSFINRSLLETIIYAEGADYGWVKMRIHNDYDDTGIGHGYGGAASGIHISNRIGGIGQIYYGFPGNAFINDGLMIHGTGPAGLRLTASGGPITFTTGAGGTGEYARFTSGKLGIATGASPTAVLDVNSDIFRLRTAKTPSSAGDTGNTGDICWDTDYIYVCVNTNTWKRTPISTWP